MERMSFVDMHFLQWTACRDIYRAEVYLDGSACLFPVFVCVCARASRARCYQQPSGLRVCYQQPCRLRMPSDG